MIPRTLRNICIALIVALAASQAHAADFEFGVQYDQRGYAGYAYATTDFLITSFADGEIGLWFSPSIEITLGFGEYVEGWLQAQFLIDAPIATISIRGTYFMEDTPSWELRAGVLIGF